MAGKRKTVSVPVPVPVSGRPRVNPEGSKIENFMVWPQHMQTIQRWMDTYDLNKSEALRCIIDAAVAPDNNRARSVVRRAQAQAAENAEQYLSARNTPDIVAQRKAKKAAAARAMRAAQKKANRTRN